MSSSEIALAALCSINLFALVNSISAAAEDNIRQQTDTVKQCRVGCLPGWVPGGGANRFQNSRVSWQSNWSVIELPNMLRSTSRLAARAAGSAEQKKVEGDTDGAKHPLVVHDKKTDDSELKVNSKFFPDLKADDVVEIYQADRPVDQSNRLLLRIAKESLAPQKGNFHLSLSSQLADLFQFRRQARQIDVIVRVVSPASYALSFAEISFKDQHISRADMWRVKCELQGHCVYRGKNLNLCGLKLQFDDCLVRGASVKNGVLGSETKLIFRSRSARLFWLIQVSEEMWDFSDDGQLYYEKAINGFLKTLFEKWAEVGVNHVVSVILFSRTFFDTSDAVVEQMSSPSSSGSTDHSFNVDAKGRLYRDHFKMVIDSEQRDNWFDVVRILKEEFMKYPSVVQWGVRDPVTGLCGQPSRAREGCCLEAINLALNVCDKHYINRDLQRTGLCISLLTASVCVWEVSRDLSQLTKQRVLSNGIGCDVICVCAPPLHVSPLFLFPSYYRPDPALISERPSASHYFHRPHWIQVKYVGDSRVLQPSQSIQNASKFAPLPACRMIDMSVRELGRRMGISAEKIGDLSDSDSESDSQRPSRRSQRVGSHTEISSLDDSVSQSDSVGPDTSRLTDSFYHRRAKYRPADNVLGDGRPDLRSSVPDMLAYDAQIFTASSAPSGSSVSADFDSWWSQNGWDQLEARMLLQDAPAVEPKRVADRSDPKSLKLKSASFMRSSISSPQLVRLGVGVGPANLLSPALPESSMSEVSTTSLRSTFKIAAPASPQFGPLSLSSSPGLTSYLNQSKLANLSISELGDPEPLPPSLPNSSMLSSSFGDESSQSVLSQARRTRWEALTNKKVESSSPQLRPMSTSTPSRTSFSQLPVVQNTAPPIVKLTAPFDDSLDKLPIEQQVASRIAHRRTNSLCWLKHNDGFAPVVIELIRIDDCLWMADALRKAGPSLIKSASALPGLTRTASAVDMSAQSLSRSKSNPPSNAPFNWMSAAAASVIAPTNPFVVSLEAPRLTYNRRRWAHLFSRIQEMQDTNMVNWKSFCKPAVLPLTTDYIPELRSANLFEVKNYRLALDARHSSSQFQELLCQRLAQDFQIVISDRETSLSVQPVPVAVQSSFGSKTAFSASSTNGQGQLTYSLSIEGQYQTLTLDVKTGDLDVTTWNAKDKLAANVNASYPYSYNLWLPQVATFRQFDVTFAGTQFEYKWNQLDELVTEVEEMDFNDSMKYRRIRFAVLPVLDHSADKSAAPVLHSNSPTPDMQRAPLHSIDPPNLTESPAELSSDALPDGSESPITDAAPEHPNEPAQQLTLEPTKVVESVAASARTETQNFFKFFEGFLQTSNSALVQPISIADCVPPLVPCKDDDIESESFPAMGRKTLKLQSDFVGRHEWVQVAYDTVYHPDVAFHFEIHWLAASGTGVDEFFGSCRRRAKTNAMRLLQISADQTNKMLDPFHCALQLNVASQEISVQLQAELISEFGFVVDGAAQRQCRQYVHITGGAVIRVQRDCWLFMPTVLPSTPTDVRAETNSMYRRLCARAEQLAGNQVC